MTHHSTHTRRRVLSILAGGTAVSCLLSGAPSLAAAGAGLSRIDARIVRKGDADYEAWRQGVVWQARKPDRFPDLIVRPRTAQGVADAVAHARQAGLRVAVKSSGHHVWANFLRDGGMLIDMWDFRSLQMEPDGETAWIGPAMWSRDIALELGRHGRAFPVAHCGSVGMGGFLLGGGMGQNPDNWGGLSCNSVIGAEVVLADGQIRVIDDQTDPDLMWALRGGGNGFPGVVVRYRVRTYPAATSLKQSTYIFPVDLAPQAFGWVGELAEAGLLRKCEPLALLMHSPMAPPDAPLAESKVCVVRFNIFADSDAEADEILDAIAPTADAKGPVFRIERQPWNVEESFYDTLDLHSPLNYGHWGVDNLWCDQPLAALEVLAQAFRSAPSALTHVVLTGPHRRHDDINAAARVQGGFMIGLYSGGSTPEDGARDIEWMRGASAALRPYAVGRYINEVDAENDPGRVAESYSADDFARLRRIRSEVDPAGVFFDYFGLPA